MGIGDKAKHKLDQAAGAAKEKQGQATNDPDREAEGRADQQKADLEQAREHVKDAFKK